MIATAAGQTVFECPTCYRFYTGEEAIELEREYQVKGKCCGMCNKEGVESED